MTVLASVGLLVMTGCGCGSCSGSGTVTTGASVAGTVAGTGISSTSVGATLGDSVGFDVGEAVTLVGELDFVTVGLIVGRAEGADESVGGDVGLTDGEGLYVFFPFLALAVELVAVAVDFALLDLLDLADDGALPSLGADGFLVPLGDLSCWGMALSSASDSGAGSSTTFNTLAIICLTIFNCLGSSAVAAEAVAALSVDRAISDAKWTFMISMSYGLMCRTMVPPANSERD
jgi:hypothetical protein